MPAGATTEAMSGTLAETPLPNLLLNLYRDQFTGSLFLKRHKIEKTVDFQSGAPVYTESNLPAESLVAQLLARGDIDRDDRQRVDEYVEQRQCREASALLALGLIDARQLFSALKEQLRRRIVDCFGWPDAEYRLEPSDEIDESVKPFRTDPFHLVQQGLETRWGMERMLPSLTRRVDRYARLKAEAARPLKRLQADPSLQVLLAKLDGYHRLGGALGGSINDPRLLAIVWSLDAADLLEYRDSSRNDEEEAETIDDEYEIEVAIAGVAANDDTRTTAEITSDPGADAEAATKTAAANAKSHELRASILTLHENLSTLNHYEVLGVEPRATSVNIKKAYFLLAKTHHPDAAARFGLGDIASKTQKVFAAIAEAFGVLSKPASRRDYDASISGEGPEIDTKRLAQAENLYLKGEVLLKMGNFKGALEFLQPAVELWPNECDYQSAYGWSLFKKSPSEPAKAREHLDKAIALKPEDAVSHFRLGLLLRAIGEGDASTEHIARAKAIDPAAKA